MDLVGLKNDQFDTKSMVLHKIFQLDTRITYLACISHRYHCQAPPSLSNLFPQISFIVKNSYINENEIISILKHMYDVVITFSFIVCLGFFVYFWRGWGLFCFFYILLKIVTSTYALVCAVV